MSKYDPLRDYLKQQTQSELVLTFEEIEDIIGFQLSRSSQRARWWEKERGPHDAMPQRNAIRDGGFEATRLPDGTGVRFKRIGLKPKWRLGEPRKQELLPVRRQPEPCSSRHFARKVIQ